MEAIDLTILAAVGMVYAVAVRSPRANDPHPRDLLPQHRASFSATRCSDGSASSQRGALRLIAETTLALVLFADASRINLRLLTREIAVPARLLGIGLPLTIVAGTVVALLVLPGLSLVEAVLLAIAVAPTDAALGQSVVSDERVPSRIRQGLNVESGLNDGLCVPLLLIALAFASAEGGGDTEPVRLVLEEIGFGVVGGLVAGVLGALAVRIGREARVDCGCVGAAGSAGRHRDGLRARDRAPWQRPDRRVHRRPGVRRDGIGPGGRGCRDDRDGRRCLQRGDVPRLRRGDRPGDA